MPYTVLRTKTAPQVVGLDEFFEFGYHSNKVRNAKNHPLRAMTNWYMESKMGTEYLERTYGVLKKDDYPATTKVIKESVIESAWFPHEKEDDFVSQEINNLITAARLVYDFTKDNQRRFQAGRNVVRGDIIRMFIDEYIPQTTKSDKRGAVPTAWLTSPRVWANFEQHLIELRAMEAN